MTEGVTTDDTNQLSSICPCIIGVKGRCSPWLMCQQVFSFTNLPEFSGIKMKE